MFNTVRIKGGQPPLPSPAMEMGKTIIDENGVLDLDRLDQFVTTLGQEIGIPVRYALQGQGTIEISAGLPSDDKRWNVSEQQGFIMTDADGIKRWHPDHDIPIP